MLKINYIIPKQHLSTAGGITAILLWSTSIALIRHISEQLGPVTGAAGVYAAGTVLCIISIFRSDEKRKKIVQLPRKYLFICGLLFVCYMLFLFLAVGAADNHIQTLEVGIINYLWPALTLLLSVIILAYKAKWLLLPGTLLALFGIFLVLTGGNSVTLRSLSSNLSDNPPAYLFGFAAALSWALYSTLTRKWVSNADSGAVAVFIPATAVALSLICLLVDEPRVWSFYTLAEVAILGAITTFAYSLWDNSMRGGNFVLVAASSYFTPFFSTLVSSAYLSISPSPKLWIGCFILITGSVLSWISIDQKPTKRTE